MGPPGRVCGRGGEEGDRHRLGGQGVERSLEHDARLEAEDGTGLAGDVEHPAAEPAVGGRFPGLEAEDGRPDVLHGEVKVVDGPVDPA